MGGCGNKTLGRVAGAGARQVLLFVQEDAMAIGRSSPVAVYIKIGRAGLVGPENGVVRTGIGAIIT